jgi:enoyl-CoA hydratase
MVLGGQIGRLPFALPLGKAMEMLFTNKPMSAEEAVSLGFAVSMAPEGRVVEETIKIARVICEKSPIIIRKIKEGVNLTLETGMRTGYYVEWASNEAYKNHPDAKEGVAAFFEKRAPRFADPDQ